MKRPEVERMRALLVEAITTLCRSGLPYSDNLKVEGLIGITLDEADIILVNLNKTFGSGLGAVSSPEKSQRSFDKSALSEEENSQDSVGETSSSERGRKSSPKKRRDSTQAHDSKRARLTPTKDAEVDQNIYISNTYSIKSPESQGGGAEKREFDPGDAELSASSESALTTASRNISDSNTPSQQENGNNQDSNADSALDRTGPIVKIEIDSDPEVEEIKIEPGLASQSCSRVPPLPHQTHGAVPETSLHNTFAPDISQTIQAISTSDLQGELFTSQLPPEFASGTQSDPNAVPIGMFSNTLTQPIAGPSGLNISQVSGAPYTQGDPSKARPVPGGIVQHKTKTCSVMSTMAGPVHPFAAADVQEEQADNAFSMVWLPREPRSTQYNNYSPEEREQIAKSALLVGNSKTARKFSQLLGKKIHRNSVRNIKLNYMKQNGLTEDSHASPEKMSDQENY